ncbi:MAG: hypothetical protein J6B77_05045 [Clostridia bacterium]|nr:hypothetical protein [Clostridia bacterium]
MNEQTIHISDILPDYHTAGGVLAGAYDSCGGNSGVSILNTSRNEYAAFCASLIAQGAILAASNVITDNRFATYLLTDADGTEYAVYTMFYTVTCNARIIFGKRAYLPTVTESGGFSAPTYVSQPVRDGIYNGNRGETITGAPGMAYVITLADGTFLLIDSGPRCTKVKTKHLENGVWVDDEEREADDAKRLYDYIKARTPENEKPVIAAWFFTHPHSDHVHTAHDFLARYKDEVEVRLGAFNFPDFQKYPTKHENNESLCSLVSTTAERLEGAGATLWHFHTGQRISFPGCEVEILFTPEDYLPKEFAWGNHTSSAFRMTFAGKTFMVLGDCEKDICQLMADKYGAYLKSDILQLSHHGVNGACVALYRCIDPEYCFWPIDAFRFTTDSRCTGTISHGFHFNAWLRDETVRRRHHYHNSADVTIRTDIP